MGEFEAEAGIRFVKCLYSNITIGTGADVLVAIQVLYVVIAFVQGIDCKTVNSDNHLQKCIVTLLDCSILIKGTCRSQSFLDSIHACCSIATGSRAHFLIRRQFGTIRLNGILQVFMTHILYQVWYDVIAVPMVIGLVIKIKRRIDMDGRSKVVVEGIDIGNFRLRIANHIYLVCTGCTPECPFSPFLGASLTTHSNLFQLRVISHGVCACCCQGVG